MNPERAAQLDAIAALAEPTRRRLYDHVVRQHEAVSRDEAAGALGLARTTAAFHLDRLVDEGLLGVEFGRRTGRSGPGAGRPSKLYRRSGCQVAVSVPERRYELAARLLADAVVEAERSGSSPRAVLDERAYRGGRELGAAGTELITTLEESGFAPVVEDGDIMLTNCPFHALAHAHTELVCGMNLQLLAGLLDALAPTGLTARPAPNPDRCCVLLSKNNSD
ncbi:helix-turn-helix transcriptional regulator [Pseudonocardia sp.]|uniref:helix-turn-helix transcriptional regulator n=1 Tax=Pseudonocardia sp. TaxID=60912 RepID=UPI003D0B787D